MTRQPEHRFIKALLRQPVDQTPVWMMRQAGRYLPEYREMRKKVRPFMDFCKTPDLATEVTLQPLKRFPLDAAIIFSDILTIPDAFHMNLNFIEHEGPCFEKPIQTEADINQLPTIDPEVELKYVMDAIRLAKYELNNRVPLIGFAGSPWTIATYMVEGKSSKHFNQIKKMAYAAPHLLERLLSHLTRTIIEYLSAQIQAGADVVMIFDTWGGVLGSQDYLQFSLKYMEQIVAGLNRIDHGKKIPIILFTKNGGQSIVAIAKTGCDAIGLDWTASLQEARVLVGEKVTLQGNLDPAALYASPAQIEIKVRETLANYGHGSGHVFNLGHGIYPDINPDHVLAMVEAVQSISKQYHQPRNHPT